MWSSRGSVFVIACAIMFTACSKDSAVLRWDPLSAAERELEERVQALKDTVWEGTTLTALVGALLGGAIAGPQGIARGAEVGRLAGAAAGRYVAQQQAAYADREVLLRAVTTDIRTVNKKTAALVSSMKTVVAQQRALLAQLSAQLVTNEKVSSQLTAKRARARKNVEVMTEGIATAKAQHALFANSRSLLATHGPDGMEPIDEEVALLTERIANMEALVQDLATEI